MWSLIKPALEGHKWVSSVVYKLPNNSWVPHISHAEKWFKKASRVTEKANTNRTGPGGSRGTGGRVQSHPKDGPVVKTGHSILKNTSTPKKTKELVKLKCDIKASVGKVRDRELLKTRTEIEQTHPAESMSSSGRLGSSSTEQKSKE